MFTCVYIHITYSVFAECVKIAQLVTEQVSYGAYNETRFQVRIPFDKNKIFFCFLQLGTPTGKTIVSRLLYTILQIRLRPLNIFSPLAFQVVASRASQYKKGGSSTLVVRALKKNYEMNAKV